MFFWKPVKNHIIIWDFVCGERMKKENSREKLCKKAGNCSSKGSLRKIKRALLIFCVFCLPFVLLGIDYTSALLGRVISHNRSGDAWFSTIGCVIVAIPGVLVSLLAMQQQEELSKMQELLHRPALRLCKAELIAWYLNWEDWEDYSKYKKMSPIERNVIEEYRKRNKQYRNCCMLGLDLKTVLKNDVGVDKIEVQDICFKIKGEKYPFKKENIIEISDHTRKNFQRFEHFFEGDMEIYHLNWLLYSVFPQEDKAWDELIRSIDNQHLQNPDYDNFECEITLEIFFCTIEERKEKVKLKTVFYSETDLEPMNEKAVFKLLSQNGRIVFNNVGGNTKWIK